MKNKFKILEQNALKNKLIELYNLILNSRGVIIAGHVTPDGDDVSSQIVLGEFLQSIGKKFVIAWSEDVPKSFHFLPDVKSIKNIHKEPVNPDDYDLFIIVDCGDIERIGDVRQLIRSGHTIINIDHHKINSEFGAMNIVAENACSIGEILYYFFIVNKIPVTRQMAVNLYVSIVTDTGSFSYDCMHTEVHLIAADLLERGIVPSDFNIFLYQSKSYSYIKLLTSVLSRLELIENGKIAFSHLPLSDFAGNIEDETDGIIEYLGMLESVSVYVLIKEKTPGVFTASMRSKFNVDVAKIASRFNGGGHMRAAGCRTEKLSYDEFKNKIISLIKKQL